MWEQKLRGDKWKEKHVRDTILDRGNLESTSQELSNMGKMGKTRGNLYGQQ